MENENNFDKRSKDVQEILGTPPGWLLRYGTLLFFVIIVILIWLSYWIQYPDVVENEIIISFNDPPTKLISPKTGYIDLIYTVHNQRVKKGQLLVSYKTDAYYKDVLMIHEKLSKIKTLDINKLAALVVDENIRVGELQNDLLQFLTEFNIQSRPSSFIFYLLFEIKESFIDISSLFYNEFSLLFYY